MKTYKYLACLDAHGDLDDGRVLKLNMNYNRLWKIQAKSIRTARITALAKLERLAKRTKLPCILLEYPGIEIGKAGKENGEKLKVDII